MFIGETNSNASGRSRSCYDSSPSVHVTSGIDISLLVTAMLRVALCNYQCVVSLPQVPRVVVEGVSKHMLHNNAQLMAGYSVSNRADQTVSGAHATIKVSLHHTSATQEGMHLMPLKPVQHTRALAGTCVAQWLPLYVPPGYLPVQAEP